MILQINVLNTISNSSQIRLRNYGLKITVGSTVVLNEVDVDAGGIFPLTVPATTAIGIKSVVLDQLGGGGITVTIDPLRVSSAIPVVVEVTRAGYTTYLNTFTIYGYDLGTGTATVPDFNIYMRPTGGITYTASNGTLATNQENITGNNARIAQSFSGLTDITSFTFSKAAPTGTPLGDMFIRVVPDDGSGAPDTGTTLGSTTITRAAYDLLPLGLNTIPLTVSGLTAATSYWIVFIYPNPGIAGNYDNLDINFPSSYNSLSTNNVIDGWVAQFNTTLAFALAGTLGTVDYTSAIIYRQPFTSKVFYYKNTNTTGTTYYNSTSGTDVLLGTTNGFTTGNAGTDSIKALRGTYNQTLTLAALTWFPEYTLSAQGACDQDCVSTQTGNSAQVDIDYSTLSIIQVNAADAYPYNNQRIHYKLYDISGALVDEKKFPFQINPPVFVYDPSLYVWDTWVVPEVGTYVLEACLEVVEKPTGTTLYNEDLTAYEYYTIAFVDGTPDFTNVGSPDNNLGTDFIATGLIPLQAADWGNPATLLEVLGDTFECCQRLTLRGCTWFSVEQTDCNAYSIANLQANDVTYNVYKMTSLGVFDTTPLFTGVVSIGETTKITLADDGVYSIVLEGGQYTDGDGNIIDLVATQIVINYCKIKACALSFINSLLCYCKDNGGCDNFCKKFYDFNAFTILSQTLFSMIAKEYAGSIFYTTLDADKIVSLYEVDQVITRLQSYCGSCCEGCKKARSGCGCGGH